MSDDVKTILITGAAGQLGLHCRARLQFHHGLEVIGIDRNAFADDEKLQTALMKADVVLHLAGVNRGSDLEVESGNRNITERLLDGLQKSGSKAQIVYSSSVHIDRDSVYGMAKRVAAERLKSHCDALGVAFTNLVLPNLYGEFSRPNYNNFSGTFVHQIINGESVSIHQDSQIELMHYREVADLVAKAVLENLSGELRPQGHTTSILEVADKLDLQFADYSQGVIPDVRDGFDLSLFNMLRDAMFSTQFPVELTRHADARGSFFECIRAKNSGQTSFSTTVPGITRGDHFHFEKVERFLVLSGNARISVRRVFDGHVHEFDVSGDEPCFVDMPVLHTHNITNTGDDELLTLFWTHDFFDAKNTDTYVDPV